MRLMKLLHDESKSATISTGIAVVLFLISCIVNLISSGIVDCAVVIILSLGALFGFLLSTFIRNRVSLALLVLVCMNIYLVAGCICQLINEIG